jgi:hypothetical protein
MKGNDAWRGLPAYLRKLLKSYELKELRWAVRGHRYEIVVAVLTRGNDMTPAIPWNWTARLGGILLGGGEGPCVGRAF